MNLYIWMISFGAFTSELIGEELILKISLIHATEHIQLFSSIHL